MKIFERLFHRQKDRNNYKDNWKALEKFVTTHNYHDLRRIVESNPQLLNELTVLFLQQWANRSRSNYQLYQILESRLTLLQRCQQVGINAAFEEIDDVSNLHDSFQEQAEFAVPPEIIGDMDRARKNMARYQQNKDLNALDRARGILERITRHPLFTTFESQFRLLTLNNCGIAYHRVYNANGNIDNLERALEYLQEAFAQTRIGSPNRAEILSNIGLALRDRYSHSGTLADLKSAIEVFEKAINECPCESSLFSGMLNNLGLGLRDYYNLTGELVKLNNAIEVWERVIANSTPNSSDLDLFLNNLGTGLFDRYFRTGSIADLERAIQVWDQAVANTHPSSSALPMYLNNLGNGLRERYFLKGKKVDLDNAIQSFQQAISYTPPQSPELPMYLSNIGQGLRDRYRQTGSIFDLDQAIAFSEQAVNQTPSESPELPEYLSYFGLALWDRYSRTKGIDDLEKAIDKCRMAVSKMSDDSPKIATLLNNLGNVLIERFNQNRTLDDLNEATDAYEQAVRLKASGSNEWLLYSNNLGTALLDRYQLSTDINDLERAVRIFEQVVAKSPCESPDFPMYLNNIGLAHVRHLERTGSKTDWEKAIQIFEQAVKIAIDIAPEEALRSSRNWVNVAFEHQSWEEVSKAYDYVEKVSSVLLRTQFVRSNKETWLRETKGLSARAAYALTKSNKLSEAVIALERSRAQLLTEALNLNYVALERLKELGYIDLYERYRQSADQWDELIRKEQWLHQKNATSGTFIDILKSAYADLDAVVKEIRCVKGYEDFLKPVVFEDIQNIFISNFHSSAVVYLVITSVGSLALIAKAGMIKVVWLNFNETDLTNLLTKQEDDKTCCDYLSCISGGIRSQQSLKEILMLLGEQIMAPIANELRKITIEKVVIVPTGRLALLPLHAASYISNEQIVYFLDEFTVSYAPNAQCLAVLQDEASRRDGASFFIGVGDPFPHPNPLKASQAELQQIAAMFPESACDLLTGERATKSNLSKIIPKGTYLHFACHGFFDSQNPLYSRLELSSQEPLTLHDFLCGEVRPVNTRLAVLSACQSAVSDFNRLPEELIGLPTGLLQTGVLGVVGTLWPVDDLSTALLMIKFYELLLAEGSYTTKQTIMQSAKSLRGAQHWLRNVTKKQITSYINSHNELRRIISGQLIQELEDDPPYTNPIFWAPFVHIGI